MTSRMDEDAILAAMAAAEFAPDPMERSGQQTSTRRPPVTFSSEAWRVVGGGVRDAVQGTLDAADDLAAVVDDWQYRKFGVGSYLVTGRDADNGVAQLVTKDEVERRTRKAAGFNARTWVPSVAEAQTPVGRFGRDVVEFGAGFATGSKALKGLDALGTVARYGRVTLAGAGAAFSSVDPMQGNLANMAKELGVPENALMEALAVDEDDSAVEARLKNAAADAATGLAFDGAFKLLAKGVNQLKALKAAKASVEAQEAVPDELLRVDKRLGQPAPQPLEPAPKVAGEASAADQLPLFDELPPVARPATVDELETALHGIPRKFEGLDEAGLTTLAKSFHDGTGYEVLERLGLDPARIDFARVLSEGEPAVERVTEMVERIAEAVQPIADRAGSKPRTWKQTAILANMVGSNEATVVQAFKGATSLLDAKAWAARQLLAGSAARLTKRAEVARDFADAPAAPQYLEFLQALEAHAALQAQFKAGTSNLGRALNSLKGTATARSAADQARMLKSMVGDADASGQATKAVGSAEDALRALADTTDPKLRRRLIEKVIGAGGDVSKIGRVAEEGTGPARWQRATREFVTGNLFSVGTGTVNLMSTAGHIGFRALSHLPVHALSHVTGKAGGREFVAQRLADRAFTHTIMPAFARGFANTMRLLSDELTGEVQALAGSFGDNSAERGLGQLRQWMDEKWGSYEPRFQRADVVRSKEWRVSKETIEAIMDNHDQLPALMRIGMRGVVGLGTGAFNLAGSAARAIRVLTIDTTDELMGAVAQQATRAAEASRIAALEGFDRGLRGDELASYARQRADVLMQHSSSELTQRIERLVALGAKEDSQEVADLAAEALRVLNVEQAAEAEARTVLFQDDLNWEVSQTFARALPHLDLQTGMIFPFIRTPLKILETTVGSYTPLGLLQKEMRDRITSGGIDAQIAVSQISMGTLAIGSAVTLAAGGYVVGYDGGPRSSSRMARPSYSMRIGDKWVEFSRFDPVGILLGLGADLHEYVLNAEDEDGAEASFSFERAVSGMFLAVSRNILSKTWMTSMRDLVGVVSASSEAEAKAQMERLGTSMAQKVVPAGGMMRWWEGTDDGVVREANTTWEKLMASTPWASELAVRRDPLLGRPVQYDRVLGIQAGDDGDDPLIRELSGLAFDLPPNTKSFKGVQLTSKQLARLKELRGQGVWDETGLTMEENLRELIASNEWAEMDRSQKVKAIRSMRDHYHPLAIEALRDEDPEFGHAVGSVELRRRLERFGYSEPEISAEMKQFRQELLGY